MPTNKNRQLCSSTDVRHEEMVKTSISNDTDSFPYPVVSGMKSTSKYCGLGIIVYMGICDALF